MKRAFLGFDDKLIQTWMLLDRVRNDAFKRAIEEVVRPGDVVLDIGTGTGLLAVWAAKRGARKVYAIERGAIGELAEKTIRDSGVASIVEIVRGDFRDLELVEKPDVVVSETLGDFGLDEGISELLRLVVKRFGDVRVVPERLRIEAFAVENRTLGEEIAELRSLSEVNLEEFVRRVVSGPLLRKIPRDECLSVPVPITDLDLKKDVPGAHFSADLRIERDGILDLVATGFTSQLSPSVSLSTLPDHPETCWRHFCFPVWPPIEVKRGESVKVVLEPRTTGAGSLWKWSVRSEREERVGDTLRGGGGSLEDFVAGLGLGTVTRGERRRSVDFATWASLFGADPDVSLDVMSERLLRDFPERYVDLEDARAEVMRRLVSTGALS